MLETQLFISDVLPYYESSMSTVFLPTDIVNIRYRIKSKEHLRQLKDTSTDIFYDSSWGKYL